MVDRRRWEDLDSHCLANVFRRVEIESLLIGVPENHGTQESFSITCFCKLVVDRSGGKALLLKLPQFCIEEALRYVSDKCPLLEAL
ncbi:hypothetical protein M0R45_013464 [Rubus argutus]|uniref:Uncharacterized protein n=1 Tax=Rubus argutus TaxID=59490 RepID=A0AAW1XII8_RUBAR